MQWTGYALGILVGSTFGFWLHDFWEGDLTGVGASPPPSFDLFLPVGLFALAIVALVLIGRNGRE